MHTNKASALALVAGLAVFSVHAADAPHMRPGMWETTVQVEMPGMPVTMAPMTQRHCVTKAMLVPQNQQPGQTCKLLDHKVSGNTVTWNVECDTEGRTMHGTGTITYTGDSSYKGKMDMTMTGGPGGTMHMTQTMSSHRVGECTQ
jgi:hypothetical protein